MKRRIALIEFSIYDQFPLVSGYLQAFAGTDPDVAAAFEFVYYASEVSRADYPATLQAIRQLNAPVLCFSCYVWNMGLIRRLVRDLSGDRDVTTIILGGHQVSNHIERYVRPQDDKVIVINGQGELPFRDTLRRLAHGQPAAGLGGVSVYTDGELWNGGEAEMLANLDDIPSPYLGGLFDRMSHPIAVFETNRGCPYKCSFCTWGGDTQRVTQFSLERVKEELRWLARQGTLFIYLADANWGMLARDPEISSYLGSLKKEFGTPLMVYYAAAKNKPKGSLQCIENFYAGGVISSQALGIQSMNPETLARVDRQNIKNDSFVQMFSELKHRGIDSYCELIWPLPGETLSTLKHGYQELIELGAQTIIMYPAILINNAKLTAQADEHEIAATISDDWKSELLLVKKTKYASHTEVEDGLWFYYAYFVLGNCDAPKALLRCIGEATGRPYVAIIEDFARYLRENAADSKYAALIATLFAEDAHGSLLTIGRLAAHITHEERLAAQRDVSRFIVTQLPHDIERAVALAVVWSCALPNLFAGTPETSSHALASLGEVPAIRAAGALSRVSIEPQRHGVDLSVDDTSGAWSAVVPFFDGRPASGTLAQIAIRHRPADMHYNRSDRTRNLVYAHGMINRLTRISAQVSVTSYAGGAAVSAAHQATAGRTPPPPS
jgi:hypothetical protein